MARGNFGERLKRERELREVTLEEITAHTRIGPRFLEALENEQWEKLPGGVFNRGFVRSVARYLGLDEESLLGEYDLAHGAPVVATTERQEDRIPSPPKWVPVAIAAGAVVLFILLLTGGFYAWKHFAARRAAKQSSVLHNPTALLPPAARICQQSAISDRLGSEFASSGLRAQLLVNPRGVAGIERDLNAVPQRPTKVR